MIFVEVKVQDPYSGVILHLEKKSVKTMEEALSISQMYFSGKDINATAITNAEVPTDQEFLFVYSVCAYNVNTEIMTIRNMAPTYEVAHKEVNYILDNFVRNCNGIIFTISPMITRSQFEKVQREVEKLESGKVLETEAETSNQHTEVESPDLSIPPESTEG